MKVKADVIIVGSGPIGSICARNLAAQGLSVIMLEAGDAITEPPGEHVRNQPGYQHDSDKFFAEVVKWCHCFNDKAPATGLPGANITQAFGGQGLLWTNNCPRPPRHERWPAFNAAQWEPLLDLPLN